MAKVIVTEQNLINIANAIREKTGTASKLGLADMPAAIRSISAGAQNYTVTLNPAGANQTYNILCDDIKRTETFSAGKGSIITLGMTPDSGYRAGEITATGGKKFSDGTYSLVSDMSISVSAATKVITRTTIGTGSCNADATGLLEGWTAFRIKKCIPNNTTVHFVATLTCPGDILIDIANSSMNVSSFTEGRTWDTKNKFVDAGKPNTVTTSTGTTYTLEWDEAVSLSAADFDGADDDAANNLVGYYCCASIKLKHSSGGTNAFTDATLRVDIQV